LDRRLALISEICAWCNPEFLTLHDDNIKRSFTMKVSQLSLLCVVGFSAAAGAQAAVMNPADDRIDRVFRSLRPPIAIKGKPAVRWTIAERMREHNVPGVSIAVIDESRVAWAGGFGFTEAGTSALVTTSTLFQAQSISKPVAASAALSLVDAGRLSLDEDVNTYLKSWKVPENEFQLEQKVTLRRILSHTAGLTVGGFSAYRSGDSIPTLLQILNGEKPANNPPVRVNIVPGSRSRYSGGGATVMQLLLMDVTGEPFPTLMERLVLGRVGMTQSTYEQPLSDGRRREAASGHNGDGAVVPGKWPIQPELAACGLWTTPTDLAKWAVEIGNAWSGRPSKLLSRKMAAEMLTVQTPPFGLGLKVEGTNQAFSFEHAGSIWGYRALLVMYPAVGRGAVVMANGDRGDPLIGEVLMSIAAEYRWPARTQSEREVVSLATRELDGLVGRYSLPPAPSGAPVYYEVSREGEQLFSQLKGLGSYPKTEIYPASPDAFFTTAGLRVVFTRDGAGRAMRVRMGQIEGLRNP
jgi:CubicO group peptidase (beta-lactamase class C family)